MGLPLRLLIIEDDAFVAFSIEDVLVKAGHTVVGFARDVESALGMAEALPFDLALVDYHLALGSCGADAARLLRDLHSRPSIFVSSSPDDCRKAWKEAGALGCLSKPFNAQTLINAVSAAEAIIAGRQPDVLPQGFEVYADG
jgi:DNA-binding response OmpR family regulator